MTSLFTSPYKKTSFKVLLLGAGELGKEIIIECQRLGYETHVIGRYEKAPAMHVSHYSYVIDMKNEGSYLG